MDKIKHIFIDSYYNMFRGWVLVAGVVIVIGGVIYGTYRLDKASCYQGYSEYAPQYTFITGCRIEWHGIITPVKMVKNLNY